ncbi:hypothetical protein Ancab_005481 [Ancistrocladus abbreviatus]
MALALTPEVDASLSGRLEVPNSSPARVVSVLRSENCRPTDRDSPYNTQLAAQCHNQESSDAERAPLVVLEMQGNHARCPTGGPGALCSAIGVGSVLEHQVFDDGLGWLRAYGGTGDVGPHLNFCVESEGPVCSGADPKWQGLAFERLGEDSNRSDAEAEVGGHSEDINRMVDSPVCQPTAPMDIAPLEQSAVQTEMNRRRQFRKKRLEDILSSSPRNSKTGKSNKCKSRYEVDVVSHSDDILLLEVAQPESDSWLVVNDSQILNMNRLHGTMRTPRQSPPRMTPQQIWDFIEQIGVRDKTNIEDVVCRIGEMEQQDWTAFQKLASAGQQNDARREIHRSQLPLYPRVVVQIVILSFVN